MGLRFGVEIGSVCEVPDPHCVDIFTFSELTYHGSLIRSLLMRTTVAIYISRQEG